MAQTTTARKTIIPRTRSLRVGLVVTATLFIAVLTGFYFQIRASIEQAARANLTLQINDVTHSIHDSLALSVIRVRDVLGFIEASRTVSESEFHTYVKLIGFFGGDNNQMRAVALMPLLASDEIELVNQSLAAREAVRGEAGYPPLRIADDAGRTRFAPVVYAESPGGRDRILGYDIATSDARIATAMAALEQGRILMTPPVKLSQDDPGAYPSVLVIGATRDGDLGLRRYRADDQRPLLVAVSYTPGAAIRDVLQQADNRLYALDIYDVTDDTPVGIYLESSGDDTGPLLQEQRIMLAGRDWALRYHATETFLATLFPPWMDLIFAAGLLLIALLTYAGNRLISLGRRLDERTRDLEIARDEANRANLSKSSFLANMSHEIRTPMNAIVGLSHLALQGGSAEKRTNYIEKVNKSAHALLGIINDILDFSKIEAGKLDMEISAFHLEDVFDNLLSVIGIAAEGKSLELVFEMPPTVPTALTGDPLRLGQVLLNLGSNAIKFTEPGGEILVSVAIEAETGTSVTLRFGVSDSGIGISQDETAHLFDAFFQADTSSSRRVGGTGLGLVISRQLVEMMGGNIEVHSEPGVGSRFTFSAKFDKQDGATASAAVRLVDSDLRSRRVLVVDDNASARRILGDMLVAIGCIVETAASGRSALDLLTRNDADQPFDLVLMDWRMPGIDGVETTRRILADPDITRIPTVIMISAYGQDDFRAAAGDLEFADILTKPVLPTLLYQSVLVALGLGTGASTRTSIRRQRADGVVESIRGARILLVEDNSINQELAADLLESFGLSVAIADNGREALERLDSESFDGILMDCEMPVMDGYEATRRIRENPRYENIPIIAMTANVMTGDRERVLEAGMNDHLGKPIDPDLLPRVLSHWIADRLRREAG